MSENNKPKRTGSNLFKPGQSGNPGGRPRAPNDLAEARITNATLFEHSIYKYFHLDPDTLREIKAQPGLSTLDAIVITILLKSLEHGDFTRLNFLLERTIGKVADRVEFKAKIEKYHEVAVRYKDEPYEVIRSKYFDVLKDPKGESE
jgi:hypothetical protein